MPTPPPTATSPSLAILATTTIYNEIAVLLSVDAGEGEVYNVIHGDVVMASFEPSHEYTREECLDTLYRFCE